ncbi:MAG: septum formation initiator family protein [Patescibacteria group bacterium]|nr:septum formation initiator family protein [Patescibacteria group bacterium]
MLDFQQKKKLRKAMYSKGVLLVLGIIVLFLGNATWNVYQKYSEARGNEENVLNELRKLQERESDLSADIERLNTQRGVEEELRKRFGVAKEGEEVMIIVEPVVSDEGSIDDGVQKEGFWSSLFHIFTGGE